MNSLRHPVGPEPPSVYWKRRAIVVGAVLLVLIGLIMLWPSGGSSNTSAASSPSPRPSASGGPSPAASPKSSGSAAPSPTSSVTASASASAVPSTTAVTDCKDSEISVATAVDTEAPKAGSEVTFTMTIANNSGAPCKRDVGAAVNRIEVTSGGYHVWASDDCSPGGPNQVETIPAGQAFAVQAVWPGTVTQTGCPTPQQKSQPGTYAVTGTNGDVTGTSTMFSLTQ